GRIVEARYQVGERRLAGPARADERDRLAGVDGEADVVQDRRAGVVAETHALELDPTPAPGETYRLRAFDHVRLGVEILEDAVDGGERVAQHHGELGQALQREVEHAEVQQKLGELADGQAAG